jgi:hypothetical protein
MDTATLDKLQQIFGPSAQIVINAAISQVYIDGIISIILFLVSTPLLLLLPKIAHIARAENDKYILDQDFFKLFVVPGGGLVICLVVGILFLNMLCLAPHMLNPNFWAYKSLLP